MKNPKGKGIRWERVVKEYFESKGYFCIRRAASLFPDLIAVSPLGFCWAVECKCKKEYLRKSEKIELFRLKDNYNMKPILAYPKYSPYSKKEGNVLLMELIRGDLDER